MNLGYLESLYFKPLKGIDKVTPADIDAADIYLNISYKELFLAHNWIQRKRYGQIVLLPRYTTGTCTVTRYNQTNEDDAKTVTFSGASLSTNMIGRFIRFQDGDKWYRIIYLTGSGTDWTAYLESPVEDVTSGSKTFEIWKRFYYLKSDVVEIVDFGRWANGHLSYNQDLLDRYTDISRESDAPSSFDVVEIDPFTDTERSGTIEIATDSNVGTVTSVDMLDSVFNIGDVGEIGGVDYFIRRVETNSRIVFFNYFSNSVSSGTPITFKKSGGLGIEVYNPPNDYYTLPYVYLGRAYDLIHKTKDRMLLPYNFIPALISRAHYFGFKDAADVRASTILNVYDLELKGLKSKAQVVKPRYRTFSPKITSLAPGRD